jgi:hypothetical protein
MQKRKKGKLINTGCNCTTKIKKPKPIKTETILEGVSGYKAVVLEFQLLKKGYGKKSCLNTNQYPYLPQTRATKTKLQNHTTFTEADRANYIKFLKKQGIDWHTIYPTPVSFRELNKNIKP